MSVPVFKRTENKLQALKDTITMTSYLINMCENDKRKKLNKMLNLVMTDKMKPEYFEQSLNGIIAHLEKGNSYAAIKEFKNYIKNVPCGTFYKQI